MVSESQCFDGEDLSDDEFDGFYFYDEYGDSDGNDWTWDCVGRCKNRGRAGSALHIRRMERRAGKVTMPGTTERRPLQKFTAGAARRARRGELSEVFANRPVAFLPRLEEKRKVIARRAPARKSGSRAGRDFSGEAELAAQLGLDLATYQMNLYIIMISTFLFVRCVHTCLARHLVDKLLPPADTQ